METLRGRRLKLHGQILPGTGYRSRWLLLIHGIGDLNFWLCSEIKLQFLIIGVEPRNFKSSTLGIATSVMFAVVRSSMNSYVLSAHFVFSVPILGKCGVAGVWKKDGKGNRASENEKDARCLPFSLAPSSRSSGSVVFPPFRTSAANKTICFLYSVNLLLTI